MHIEVKTSPFGRKKQQILLIEDEELFKTLLNLAEQILCRSGVQLRQP